jgi:hypothetical protein
MMRYLTHILIAVCLSLIETSFFASFQGIVRFTPLVLVVSVYLLQHHTMRSAASWLIIHGLMLDFSKASVVPFITISYVLVAWVAIMSAERLFSNRSFYGVAACTGISYLTFEISSFVLQFIYSIAQKIPFYWGTYFADAFSRLIMLVVLLTLLFTFAKRIRHILVKASLISPSRQTY